MLFATTRRIAGHAVRLAPDQARIAQAQVLFRFRIDSPRPRHLIDGLARRRQKWTPFSGQPAFSKKESAGTIEDKRRWIDPFHCELSIQRQCQLLGLARSSYHYPPRPESEETLALLRRLDELYRERPLLGSRRMVAMLGVNRKRIQRLMRIAGIEALYPKPRLSRPGLAPQIHPYLLRDRVIDRPNQVWAGEITYVPMRRGFFYLVAVMDWFGRYVLSRELSATLDTGFCLAALEAALGQSAPEIFNTDQGS